ncbi:DUF1488 family protein [Aquamicrobium soli]|jgi:hypothetical protein|uniref:DUF1488 domain-containing protein n=1 Tax=Aquamicrobium soli TaxID=1811518 RepID=A0ABV7KCQ2_9HYPH
MTLAFPNPSRSFDDVRNGVRFIGHDGMFQVSFLVESDALIRSGGRFCEPEALEAKCLAAFDIARPEIHRAAKKAYAKSRRKTGDVYTLTGGDLL